MAAQYHSSDFDFEQHRAAVEAAANDLLAAATPADGDVDVHDVVINEVHWYGVNEADLRDDPDDIDADGISGRAHRLADGRIGRFGWKSGIPTLEDFVRDALSNEIGLTLEDSAEFIAGIAGALLVVSMLDEEEEDRRIDSETDQCDLIC